MNNSLPATAVVLGGLPLLRQFANTGIPIVVIPRSADALCTYSRYYCGAGMTMDDLRADASRFLERLIELAKSFPVTPVLYYGDDAALFFLMKNREVLAQYFRFALPDQDILEACSDKMDFAHLALEKELPVPAGMVADASLDCAVIEERIGFPCVFKPGSHLGWFESEVVKSTSDMPQKVLLANNRRECERALKGIRDFTNKFVIQEFIPGGEDEIYSFHTYVSQEGIAIASYVGKKVRTYPAMGGESTYIKLVRNDRVTQLGLEVVEKLDIVGVMKIDFKKDSRRDRYYVLEINLRFNLWNHLGTRAGINLAELAYQDLCGLPMTVTDDYRDDLHWLDLGRDFRSLIEDYWPSGQLSILQWLRSLARPKIYALFEWSDPMPFLFNTLIYIKRGLKKYLLPSKRRGNKVANSD